jgi:diguanylate cyclase (GGDEF)-like protein
LDLNRFKNVNDTLGHQAGDAALVEAARRLRCTIRNAETVGRIGGDEFAILLPDISGKPDVDALLERIRDAFGAPLDIAGNAVEIGVSAGVAYYPADAATRDALLEVADADMYRVKGANATAHP